MPFTMYVAYLQDPKGQHISRVCYHPADPKVPQDLVTGKATRVVVHWLNGNTTTWRKEEQHSPSIIRS